MNLTKKRIIFIINPISGTISKDALPRMIGTELDARYFDIQIYYTEFAGHATLIAAQAVKDGIDYVAAVGGDGTCNEVAQALVYSKTALCIIPIGSGNGLARHLGISMDIRRSLQNINDQHEVILDYGKANDKLFFTTCGVGFDALVSAKFAEEKKRGGITYMKTALLEFLKYKHETYTIESKDGVIKEKAFIIACGNASQYGNNAYIAPHASMQDGLLNITIIEPFTPLEAGPMAVQLFTKHLNYNPRIKSFETKGLTIIRDKPGVMHIDGDPVEMDARITITCMPQGLRAITPIAPISILKPFHDAFYEAATAIRQELNIKP